MSSLDFTLISGLREKAHVLLTHLALYQPHQMSVNIILKGKATEMQSFPKRHTNRVEAWSCEVSGRLVREMCQAAKSCVGNQRILLTHSQAMLNKC